ncbi:hypothetical protein [Pseudomonas rhizoryzae]|uniref:hypothetical protein n=1 Tax=Pseudomonas rhizoryzae TaxID=2571129 RepID=UPI0007366707|nr:hypothetical protein [Pseudomonas rhizoryzae]KTT04036.1 hypothetical protein NS376_05900 [Pseudomonas psychrotolerans]KTT23530.1 hypothetical protein SB14R_13765 [Pseudomonas psychrotolerans]KTT28880.1 hypothetical protein NS201_18540 [Pseudomonas psychrotolerans]KTT36971.1 hypothetical protein SB9_03470 [Pseudomonas psychrotolerans]KTT58500.1 hypothetical protein SB8_07790 [Pseudomonas psychrotolerans]
MTLNFIQGKVEFDDFSPLEELADFKQDLFALKEDMLQVAYENDFLLDVGWYPSFNPDGCFDIRVIKDFDWESPLYIGKARSLAKAIKRINEAQNISLPKESE